MTIDINGVVYPCRLTMGAMLRFKRETGKDVGEGMDVSATITLLWCACKSACNADKVGFEYSLDDFADNITPEQLSAWTLALGDGGEKKTDAVLQ